MTRSEQPVSRIDPEAYTEEYFRTSVEGFAEFAASVNERTDDIGARRLHTLMEKLLEEVSFNAPDMGASNLVIDESFVLDRLRDLVEDEDLSRFIL